MEMIFHSHANKTHFHKKGCALGLILIESVGFWNSEVTCSRLPFGVNVILSLSAIFSILSMNTIHSYVKRKAISKHF